MIGTILTITAPVFTLILAGYLAVRLKAFPKEGVRFVMLYAQNFAVPLILFNALRQIDFANSFRFEILASYFLPMFLIFLLGFYTGRKFGKSPTAATVWGFNAFFANSVLLGLPIALRAYGAESLWVNYVILAVHSPIGYLIGALSMEFAKPRAPRLWHTLRNALFELCKNPLIIGILAGLIVNLFKIKLPHFLNDAISMQAGAALPAALFALGGVLTSFKLKGAIAPIISISALRLFLAPALVFITGHSIFQLEPAILSSVTLIATMPTGTNGFIFASLYKTQQEIAASIVFLSTIISIFTISLWLVILERLL